MGRLIELLVVIALALTIWRLARDLFGTRRGDDPGASSGGRTYEATARCARCGTHVPRQELDKAGLCPRCK